mmetsp:Transcript_27118/g.78258  ORF Transcript_27118/g.78258 Transcript_27118/m.78258 type:complete len:295 (+) Transcript_27118:42-926(+)
MRRPRTKHSALAVSFALVSKPAFSVSAFSADHAPLSEPKVDRGRNCHSPFPSSSRHVHSESKVGRGRQCTFYPLVTCALSFSSDARACLDEESADEEAVREQLGYLPSNYVRVTSYTSRGQQPVAIQTYPLNGGAMRRKTKAKGELTPFPTLYWLANAEISRAVAELERTGFVGVLEEKLRSKDSYVEDYIAAHQIYAHERWQSLTDQDRAMLEGAAEGNNEDRCSSNDDDVVVTPGMVLMIRNSGIAGRIPPFEPCIKCLHSHYAHYRSGGEANIVGRWVGDLLLEKFPELDL